MRFVVVTGPPCAGKTTYIDARRNPADVVIDLDKLAHAFGYPADQIDWSDYTHPARFIAIRARASAIKAARGLDSTAVVWLVAPGGDTTLPGAEVVNLDPGREECHRRADVTGRPQATHDQIDAWYARQQGASRPW